jgi:serine/threonine protein kinase
LKKPKTLKTAFSTYTLGRSIGQGGNGYVYEAVDERGSVAAKVLDPDRATKEKLKRFENEYKFCAVDRHPNIIKVLEYGLTEGDAPFFTMPLYAGSIRELIGTVDEEQCFLLTTKILDGVEASHKFGVIHRDLKPENILYSDGGKKIVITDFGIAEFGEEELFTAVETKDGTRLANFQYAAPEQRVRGGIVNKTTDIYSLGLIVNELFTGELALGKNHKSIGDISEKYSFLDAVIERMLQQEIVNRYQDVEDIKMDISARSREYLSALKISELNNTAIPTSEIDDRIVSDPIKIIDVIWDHGILTIHLSHQPTRQWYWAFNNMGGHSAVRGKGPEIFEFRENKAIISAQDLSESQRIIDYFKQWLPRVARVYENKLKQDAENEKRTKIEEMEKKIAEEENQKSINAGLSF